MFVLVTPVLPSSLGDGRVPNRGAIAELQSARVEAAAKADALREEQESILGKLGGIVLTLRRPTNDKGILYGSVSQRDISDALVQGGFNVGISAVRLSVAIRRTGNYEVPIQFGKELRTSLRLLWSPNLSSKKWLMTRSRNPSIRQLILKWTHQLLTRLKLRLMNRNPHHFSSL